MVAIKDMEMPKNCGECNLTACKGYDEPWNYCCSVTLTDINLNDTTKPSDCPLVEIEPLTDSEQRIFLSAMSREMRICKQIDNDKVDDSTVKKLVPIVNTIERKIKKVLWN